MTLYEKVGRRYKPVADTLAYEGLSAGLWLVVVKPGMKSIRRLLDPEYPEIEAALYEYHECVVEALRQAHEAEPETRPLTPTEQRAWQAYSKILKGDAQRMRLVRKSMSDIADAAAEALRKKIREKRDSMGATLEDRISHSMKEKPGMSKRNLLKEVSHDH